MKPFKSDKRFIKGVQRCKPRIKEPASDSHAGFVIVKGTAAGIDSLFEPEHLQDRTKLMPWDTCGEDCVRDHRHSC
jgi:hypothetical protein